MTDFADRYVTIDDPIAAFDQVMEAVAVLLAAADEATAPNAAMPLDWSFDRLRYHFVETLEKYTDRPDPNLTPTTCDAGR